MDGVETALLLITENEGTITPYGVVYDNGMELSLIYQGRNFPEYLYEEGLMTVSLQSIHASDDSSEAVWLYLPAPERQIARMLCRGGLESEEFAKLEIQINNLPAVVETACALERESVFELNAMCAAISKLARADRAKLEAAVTYMKQHGLSVTDHGYAAWNGGEVIFEYSQPKQGPFQTMGMM